MVHILAVGTIQGTAREGCACCDTQSCKGRQPFTQDKLAAKDGFKDEK